MKTRYLKIAGLVALIIVVAGVAFFPFYWNPKKSSTQVIFSDFMDLVETGQIAGTVVFNEGTHTIYAHVTAGQHLRTIYSKEATGPLQELLKKKGIRFAIESGGGGSIWLSLLFNMLPFLLIIGLFVMMGRRSQMGGGGGPMSFGKSKAKLHDATKPKVTFADVAGEEEPKEELLEVIEFLKHPQKFQALHAKIPRGLLLVGPPGCGKTLLAKAVAGEASVPFFSLSGSEFVEVFVGVGASRVRDLFEQAKKNAPCLVFIDEIDAVGRHRGAGLGGGNDEREQTLNQLLVAMDGFEANSGIIVIAATNRPDILDPALLRPGRFDRRIIVDNPDSKGRKAILQVHLREIPVAPDVNVDVLAKQTPGFSGADLASVVNEGALLAARREKKMVNMVDFDEAVERVIAGPLRRSRALTPKEREMVAYHEAGHAILRKLIPHADPPHKVTIISRGMALGYVMGAPPEDRYTRTRSELLAEVSVAMGGRVAEDLVFGEITTGASNDFEQATNMVRRMVTNFGMSDKLGPVTLGRQGGPVFLGRDMIDSRNYSEEIAYQIDQEVRRLLDEAYQYAHRTIEANREKLNRVAKALIERETLYAEELDDVMAGKVVALEPSRPTASAGAEADIEAPTAATPDAPPVAPPATA
ncbi:ATP-dependent zinc metalloprotease FtsH [Candidatus Methylomirabilis sp.]|uniref:ATP-dependent zinc metalloprotease FtsH n=1 Tax=Candidatus Methylomirabilis tolerans TaxID=3123416 RepID=A0AAJ1AG96_9BACT|nr:ATP-dependent zinc metalloprotease FtsH [Candidatus Methylomirabilis sp.]